ncbi:MAG: hypothetical protein B6240_00315 [Desulfobacteraceae bacterium 4572_87]|nr:MAG: hypothetical protein B6240_00315 [Desulfobacteraceae bacterium 4572_87]
MKGEKYEKTIYGSGRFCDVSFSFNNQVAPITVSNLFGVNKIGFQVNGWYWRCGARTTAPTPMVAGTRTMPVKSESS